MFGDAGFKLIQECKRNPDKLPIFNEPLVSAATNEINDLYADLERHARRRQRAAADPSKAEGEDIRALMHVNALRRNKRCLLAYINDRSSKIRSLNWEIGKLPTQINNALSVPERKYFARYQEIVNEFKSHYLDLDLTGNLTPPNDLYIVVRVVKDCGEIMTEKGPIRLIKDSEHYLRRADVEKFITLGYLKHVD